MTQRYVKMYTEDDHEHDYKGYHYCEIVKDMIVKQVTEFRNKLFWATEHAYKSSDYPITDQPEFSLEHQERLIDCIEITQKEFYSIWDKAHE